MLDYAAFPEQRQSLIKELLVKDGRVLCVKLSQDLQVSEHTIRRDLRELEREAEAKRLAQKRIEAEREAVPKDFKLMAQKREMKMGGWGDRGEQWKAAPEGLKKLIDGYNAAPKEMRPAILDRILNDGQRREQVRELLAEQRQQYRANDRGMER